MSLLGIEQGNISFLESFMLDKSANADTPSSWLQKS
jgi:hypothetical protein